MTTMGRYVHFFLFIAPVFISQCSAQMASEELIGPKPSPLRESFNCTNSKLWRVFPYETNSLKVGLDGGNVEFTWLGSTSPEKLAGVSQYHEFDESRWSQFIKSSEMLQVKRGFKNQVRMVWEVVFKEPEFGAIVTPVAIQIGRDGKELGMIQFQRICLPQQLGPNHIHTAGMNFEPSADAVGIVPALKFTGNAMRCTIKSVIIEPTAETPKWDPLTRTGDRIPEVRYYDDGIRPKPDSPKLTPKEIDEYLASCSKAKPEIRRVDLDPPRVELYVNDERIPPAIHLSAFAGLGSSRFGDFDDVGVRIAAMTIKAGPTTDSPAAPANVWLGKGKYDFEPVREAIRYVIARAPHTYIMLHLTVDVYNDWGVEHPDDVYANAKGEKAVASWSRTTRYGGQAPGAN